MMITPKRRTQTVEKRIKKFLKENNRGVMAACFNGKPHSSFMTYLTDEAGLELYMVSLKETTKFRALAINPKVSFLVDNREIFSRGDLDRIQALTAAGNAGEWSDCPDRDGIFRALESIDPGLRRITSNPDAALLRVKVESFLFLDGPTDSFFMEV